MLTEIFKKKLQAFESLLILHMHANRNYTKYNMEDKILT